VCAARSIVPQPLKERAVEVLLLLWDEMDDWLGAARMFLRMT
jgi:hypothetical protein